MKIEINKGAAYPLLSKKAKGKAKKGEKEEKKVPFFLPFIKFLVTTIYQNKKKNRRNFFLFLLLYF